MSPLSRGRHAAVATVLFALLAVAGCGESSETDSPSGSDKASASSDLAAPELPKGWIYASGKKAAQVSAETPQLPATVTDGTKAQVTVRDVSKVIVGGDDVAEILAGLGMADKVYAAPNNSTGPTASKAPEKFQFRQGVGPEGLLAVKGTLFIGNNPTRHGPVAEKFRAAGTDAVVMDDQQDTPDKIRAVASYLGVPDAGEKLAQQVADQLSEAKAIAGPLGKVRILQVTATGAGGANAVVGTGTAGADIIASISAISVGVETKMRGYSRVYNNEALLGSAPDVILMSTEDVKKWNGEAGFLKAFPTLPQTPAGQANRVIVLPDDQIKYAGPATGSGAKALAQALVDTLGKG